MDIVYEDSRYDAYREIQNSDLLNKPFVWPLC